MESFCYNDNHYSNLEELIHDLFDSDEEEIKSLPEDWSIKVELSELEPMFKLDASRLEELLYNSDEERYSEDAPESDRIKKALDDCVDFEKLNKMIPKLYYPSNKFEMITKKDLLESI